MAEWLSLTGGCSFQLGELRAVDYEKEEGNRRFCSSSSTEAIFFTHAFSRKSCLEEGVPGPWWAIHELVLLSHSIWYCFYVHGFLIDSPGEKRVKRKNLSIEIKIVSVILQGWNQILLNISFFIQLDPFFSFNFYFHLPSSSSYPTYFIIIVLKTHSLP